MEPTTIGRYVVERRLGSGGMGTVYLCRHQALQRPAAVKVPSEAVRADATSLARFCREAQEAAGLRHDHIVVVHDADLAHDPPYLAMDYVDGPSLAELLSGRRVLSVERTVELLRPIASALDHCHERGRTHRDVKPGNVLIDHRHGREWPVLVDFGLVLPDGASPLTATGMLHGTAPYMSPEQVDGRPASAASDLYALACVAFECLTGVPPFRGGSEIDILLAHRGEQPPRASAVLSRVPAAADDVLLAALAKDPVARRASYPSVVAFVEALAACVVAPAHDTMVLPVTPTASPPVQRPVLPPARRRAPVAAAAAVALLGGAGAYVAADALVDRTPPPPERLAFGDPVDEVVTAGAAVSPAERTLLGQGPLDWLRDCASQEPQNTRISVAVGCSATVPGVNGLLLRQTEPGTLQDVMDSDSREDGDCASEVGVDSSWARGPLSCYDNNAGVAALQWGYADSGLLFVAVRNDGDNAALWDWWSAQDWSSPAGPSS